MSKDFTHQAIDQALRAELDGKIIRDVRIEDFVQAAFPKAYRGMQQSPLYDNRKGYFSAVEQVSQSSRNSYRQISNIRKLHLHRQLRC